MDCLADVRHLALGIGLELGGLEVIARTELQGLLAERTAQHVTKVGIGIVDNPVKCCTGKITQQDRLCIGWRLQPIDKIGKRMMAIVLKTGGNGRDVDQHVGLNHLKSVVEHLYFQTLIKISLTSHLSPSYLLTFTHSTFDSMGLRNPLKPVR